MPRGSGVQRNDLHFARYEKVRPFFDYLVQKGDLSEDRMSGFWREYLDKRSNFPTFNEAITFRRTMASGIGYSTNIDEASERTTFLLDLGRAKCCTPTVFLQENQESNIGQPFQYSKDDILSSPAGLHNCANAYQILTALKNAGLPRVKRVFEIGAGYGGVADVLIRNLAPDIYVICDLPQNLFLSAYYLSVNHPTRKLQFVHSTTPKQINRNSLVFCTPAGIGCIEEKFDLVVNTYSFQEMTLSEIDRYFRYVAKNIDDAGLFYFLNTYGAAGAQKPTDYPFSLFEIKRWRPFVVPHTRFLHRKQHMEVILQKRTGQDCYSQFKDLSHILSLLMFMGINLDIVDSCDQMIQGRLSGVDRDYLTELRAVVFSETPKAGLKRIGNLSNCGNWDHTTYYISGLLSLFDNDYSTAMNSFKRSIEAGLQGLAKSRAFVAIALISEQLSKRSDSDECISLALENTPQYEEELRQLPEHVNLELFKKSYKFAFPRLKIDVDPIWKRIARELYNRFRQS